MTVSTVLPTFADFSKILPPMIGYIFILPENKFSNLIAQAA